jgi:hypothetical protein
MFKNVASLPILPMVPILAHCLLLVALNRNKPGVSIAKKTDSLLYRHRTVILPSFYGSRVTAPVSRARNVVFTSSVQSVKFASIVGPTPAILVQIKGKVLQRWPRTATGRYVVLISSRKPFMTHKFWGRRIDEGEFFLLWGNADGDDTKNGRLTVSRPCPRVPSWHHMWSKISIVEIIVGFMDFRPSIA